MQDSVMKFPPTYSHTSTITRFIYDLDVLKAASDLRPIPKSRMQFLRQSSILKSSLYSARIEGNPLTIDDVQRTEVNAHSQDVHTREVTNLVIAYESLDLWNDRPLSRDLLKEMHVAVMDKLSLSAGSLRTEESAIFNQAGVAVYLAPAPQEISGLLDEMLAWVAGAGDPVPLVAAVSHIWFEKIHPFDDGNGRVGRLLTSLILSHGGFGFGGIVPFEEYLEAHRQDYYDALGKDRQEVTEFVEFFLGAIVSQVKTSLIAVEEGPPVRHTDLLPRRAEIVEIVGEHKLVSFDFLSRRFRRVPARTLHYDLAQLIKSGYIRRLGTTRGALYASGEKAS